MLSGLILFLPSSNMSFRILLGNNFDYTEFVASPCGGWSNATAVSCDHITYKILNNVVLGELSMEI